MVINHIIGGQGEIIMSVIRSAASIRTTILMDKYTHAVVDSAARYTGQTRTGFIISAARKEAEKVAKERISTINEIAPMVLSVEDSRIFLEAMEQDFKPNQALLDLELSSHQNIVDRT
jgi:uncharacterized protein (DUF1778 family)